MLQSAVLEVVMLRTHGGSPGENGQHSVSLLHFNFSPVEVPEQLQSLQASRRTILLLLSDRGQSGGREAGLDYIYKLSDYFNI